MKKFYIYTHTKPNGEIFYIGKGKGNRAFRKKNRSSFWHNTTNKYPDYTISIIYKNLTEQEVFKLEKEYINKIGRRDLGKGTLVNMTNGGEGASGIIWSEETIKKRKESRKLWYDNNKEKFKNLVKESNIGNNHAGILILDTQTGIYYESIKEASESSIKTRNSIIKYLNGYIKNKTNFIKC